MKNHISLRLTAAGTAAILAGMTAVAQSDALRVRCVRPDRGEVTRFITLPGRIAALQQATLYAKVPGYLVSLNVDKGDAVVAGDLLGILDAPELNAELAKAQAELIAAEVEYKRVQEARSSAPDLMPPKAEDDARARRDVARAALKGGETMLGYTRLIAPFDGIITERYVDPGAFIPSATSGSAANQAAIVRLMDFRTVRVQIPVPEAEAWRVTTGQTVLFSVDVLEGSAFTAKVSRISYALDPASQTMLVEAEAPNSGLTLRPGMFVTTHLGVETRENILRVPTDAVRMEKAGASVFILSGGTARKTPVRTGFRNTSVIEIIDGLTPGDRILVPGLTPIAEGQAIQPMDDK